MNKNFVKCLACIMLCLLMLGTDLSSMMPEASAAADGMASMSGMTHKISSMIWKGPELVYAKDGENPYQVEVGHYGMTPIYAAGVEEGDYEVSVESNSRFFKIVHGTLVVKDDQMNGSIEIGSHSYLYVYPGTAEEAEAASEDTYIEPEEKGDSYVFSLPVEALNKPIPCAAYSKRKKKWYDRLILFDASTLPSGSLKFELPDYEAIDQALQQSADGNGEAGGQNHGTDGMTYGNAKGSAYDPAEPVKLPMKDGEYSIEVSMTGGTGRATISSPTLMIVKDGKAYARILMSSSHYDWMIAGGVRYMNENSDGGNSCFTIPISAMDTLINIIADTTAMGDPVAINYTLTFYEETIGNKGQIPQEAAKKVLVVAAIIIVVGAVINHFTKKNRRRSKKSGRKRR